MNTAIFQQASERTASHPRPRLKPEGRRLIPTLAGWAVALLSFVRFASAADEARFFRVMGPLPTTITEFRADGFISWTNAPTNATFRVQVARSLTGPSNWVDYIQVPATNGATTTRIIDFRPPSNMTLVPAGSFTMGDTFSEGFSDELPLRTVYVSAFYLDVNLVSYSQWQSVYAYATNRGYGFVTSHEGKAADHPVQTVDWYDSVKWCNARSEQAGRTPVYYTDAGLTEVYTNGEVTVYVNWSAGGYRLPTEAEWEKAARGGLSGNRFPWGDTITHSNANYYSSASYAYDTSPTRGYHPTFATGGIIPYTSPVGCFAANGYGLYDMAGNVWEWCWDWYGSYNGASQADPQGPTSGRGRVIRGGGWYGDAFDCRSAFRIFNDPSRAYNNMGLRCVRSADH
jgi:formylglycine-generating enzyme required for sulfatase activity